MSRLILFTVLSVLLANSSPAEDGQPYEKVLKRLNSGERLPLPAGDPRPPAPLRAKSGGFTMESPGYPWGLNNSAGSGVYELEIQHYEKGSWIKARTTDLHPRGVTGALNEEIRIARSLIDYESGFEIRDENTKTYKSSALVCGVLFHARVSNSCSLVHVALLNGKLVRTHSLIMGLGKSRRDELINEFTAVLSTLAPAS